MRTRLARKYPWWTLKSMEGDKKEASEERGILV
jgi:hypothetical protein